MAHRFLDAFTMAASGRIMACSAMLALILSSCAGPEPEPAVSGEAETSTPGESRTIAASAAVTERDGEDWPRFLGPRGTGVSGETGILVDWPKSGPPILWKKTIGEGYGAPSVLGDRLVVHHRLDDEEIVECLHVVDGKSLWTFSYPSDFSDPYGYSNGPRCSPVLTESRCYTYGAEGVLTCLALESGEKTWQRDMKRDFTLPDWFFGVGCTPILEDGLLITLVGGQPNSGVVAFDAATGKTVWENVGRETWDGVKTGWPGQENYEWTGEEQIVSYSSPIAATIHGRRHVLCLGRQGLVSLDPKTGELNFKYWFRSRAYESVNAASPIVIGDKIYLSAAYKMGSVLLQVGKDGKSVNEVWRDTENLLTHWSTAIHVDGHIYGFSGRHEREGAFRCLDLETGKVAWSTTGFDGNLSDLEQDPLTGGIRDRETGEAVPWPFFGRGSKIKVEDKFIVLGERGTLALAKIDPAKYVELARVSYDGVDYPSWAAPILSRKRLILRSETTLLCLDLAPRKKAE